MNSRIFTLFIVILCLFSWIAHNIEITIGVSAAAIVSALWDIANEVRDKR